MSLIENQIIFQLQFYTNFSIRQIEPRTELQNTVRSSIVSEIDYITFYSSDIQYRYASEYTAASETVPQAFSVVLP